MEDPAEEPAETEAQPAEEEAQPSDIAEEEVQEVEATPAQKKRPRPQDKKRPCDWCGKLLTENSHRYTHRCTKKPPLHATIGGREYIEDSHDKPKSSIYMKPPAAPKPRPVVYEPPSPRSTLREAYLAARDDQRRRKQMMYSSWFV